MRFALALLLSLCWTLFAGETGARGSQVGLNVDLAHPVLLAGEKRTTYLKVGLSGFSLKKTQGRAAVNVAIVLDKSGSMAGEKIQKAKEAAILVLQGLSGEDIVSVIAYDHEVQVLVPATKVSDKSAIAQAIEALEASGNTALFAGVSKGAAEVRKFLAKNRANRVVLLSDGLANVGPSSPGELGALGASLVKEGISVSTVGLGLDYNEDLMSQLAAQSDGNHAFAQTGADLIRIFQYEFNDILSVVAQEVAVTIRLKEGVRPVRVLGRDADIDGQTVTAHINQLYAQQEKFVMLEVELAPGVAGQSRDVAEIEVSYANMETRVTDRLAATVGARFTAEPGEAEKGENPKVMVDAIELVAAERNRLALRLRDENRTDDARQELIGNSNFLREKNEKYKSAKLKKACDQNDEDASNLDPEKWGNQRKKMREEQQKAAGQRGW